MRAIFDQGDEAGRTPAWASPPPIKSGEIRLASVFSDPVFSRQTAKRCRAPAQAFGEQLPHPPRQFCHSPVGGARQARPLIAVRVGRPRGPLTPPTLRTNEHPRAPSTAPCAGCGNGSRRASKPPRSGPRRHLGSTSPSPKPRLKCEPYLGASARSSLWRGPSPPGPRRWCSCLARPRGAGRAAI